MSTLDPRVSRRLLLVSAPATLALSGCFGGFNLTKKVHHWNADFNKWVSWLIFLAFIILPVYSILLLIDGLVINSIEFWTGNNPVDVAKKVDERNEVVMKTIDEKHETMRVEHRQDGEVVAVFHLRKDERGIVMLDEHLQPTARVHGHRGGARLRDRHGRTVADLPQEDFIRAQGAAVNGDPIAEVIVDSLQARGAMDAVASLDLGVNRVHTM